eukprot:TRINITY_DN4049_c0_g1_i1.p1 TRINITY_DN4049_c0_g1~~TRINITY_DN4049_c0_g1_i1.p1  ORF type:complete len:492 (-),score=99.60 TRINITY_DN4049_c0_g1_i1:94-1569(-)
MTEAKSKENNRRRSLVPSYESVSRSPSTPATVEGVLEITVIEAKNLAGLGRTGTSDPYAVVKSSFNKQQFKTKTIKRTVSPSWNETFKFYTKTPEGQISIKIWDKDRWTSDDFLGEATVSLDNLSLENPVEEWYQLKNEPKKHRNKEKSTLPGEVKLRLHYPGSKKNERRKKQLQKSTDTITAAPTSVRMSKEKSIKDYYTFGKELGRGGFSVVVKGVKKETNQKVAIKIIEKNNAGEEELLVLQREIDIMEKLSHKNIIQLIETYDENEFIYLVLELVTGGELFDQIVSRGAYGERDAAIITKQILEAIDYMHSNGIAHRDLKPENLLCSGKNANVIKITDFGLSKNFGQEALKTSCGTPDYVAPEVLRGMPYDNSVDVWAIGVVTYILLCGFPPFYGENDQQIFEKILNVQFTFPTPDWDNISNEAKDFILSILVLDVSARPSARQCLSHPWLLTHTSHSADKPRNLQRLESFRDQMKEYNEKRSKARK